MACVGELSSLMAYGKELLYLEVPDSLPLLDVSERIVRKLEFSCVCTVQELMKPLDLYL